MLIQYFTVSFVLLLVHSSSGTKCTRLSFKELCVTEGSTVVLENERLSMTINRSRGQITGLYFNSKLNTSIKSVNLLSGGSGYYLANIYVNGKSKVVRPDLEGMKITENDELIDVAFIKKNNTSSWPINLEYHLVLERNSSIFYYYSIHKYLSDHYNYTAEQLRWALKGNSQSLKYYSVDGKRAGTTPTQTAINSAKTVQDSTYMFSDGKVYAKYQQISSNEDINTVYGIYGDSFGLSQLQTRNEWVSGGPFKQDLTTHTGPMLLFHEQSAHYGTPKLEPTVGWTKVYGPIGYYLNDGESISEMYSDAQRQLKEEEKKWPYKFVTAPEYNAEGRGSMSGVLTVDGSPNKEWVYLILTDPNVDDPQLESATYMYSANTAEDGSFTIPAVRPGTYKLHVIAKGVVGTHIHHDIQVQEKKNTDLGMVNWVPESNGKLLWQIGVPDRTSAEFKSPPGFPSPVPNLEEFRKFGTWLNYSNVFPNDPDFIVGQSDPAEDWCYFMPMVKTPGYSSHLKLVNLTKNTNPTNWKVRFDYNGSTEGNATLTLGFAGKVKAGIRALINGQEILKVSSLEGPSGDSSLFRQAAHGIFLQKTVTFSQSLLKKNNTLEFTPPGEVGDSDMDKMVTWDFLRMEVSD